MRMSGERRQFVEDMPSPSSFRAAFGPFVLHAGERLLTRDGVPVEIGGRSLDLLTALVERAGAVVGKRDLLRRVWPDVVVEDGSLRFQMAALRRTLGEGVDGARYISTQVGVGYAFVAKISPRTEREVTVHPRTGTITYRQSAPPLPCRSRRLLGRDDDVPFLIASLGEHKLCAIVGAAGVGKTTLAVEVGHRVLGKFAGRVHFVDLGALDRAELVASAIADALGIPVQAEDPLLVVLGHLRDQRLLLVLDNCEHLIDAVSDTAERIGEAAPGVRILATSREPLRIVGEQVHWLGALAYPGDRADALEAEELAAFPAVELFVERAMAANSGFRVDREAVRGIADLCARLDGMALPIELTAVRAAVHGLEATARMLGARFSLGWTGRRTAVARQQTLQATLDWSYDLLSETEQRTFERLSVFLGPFSLEAALAVGAGDDLDAAAVAMALDALIAKSLVAADRGSGPNAYRLLEMTRAHAQEKLRGRGSVEAAAAARRHAAFYLALLEDIRAQDGSYSRGRIRIVGQIGNIRSALATCFDNGEDPEQALRLSAVSAPIFLEMSLLAESRDWCARALALLEEESGGTPEEYELQATLGLTLMFTRGNSDAVEAALRRALEIAVSLGDARRQLRLLGRLHIFHERIGDYAAAHEWAEMALAVAATLDDPEASAVAASLSGISHHLGGDQKLARERLERAVRLSLPSERWRTIHYGFDHRNRSIIALARTFWLLGHADRARRLAEEAVREAERLDHPTTHCIALIWALPIHIATGDLARAAATLDSFEAAARRNAFAPYVAAVGGLRGNQALRKGDWRAALDGVGESLTQLQALRYDLLTTSFSSTLTLALMQGGRRAEALELIDATIARCAANGEHIYTPNLLRIKAAILVKKEGGRPECGQAECGQALALLEEALAWSRRQGALAWELWIMLDLAPLLAAQGRGDEALERLAAVRAAFTEGFDTGDLRRADALLETLREERAFSVESASRNQM